MSPSAEWAHERSLHREATDSLIPLMAAANACHPGTLILRQERGFQASLCCEGDCLKAECPGILRISSSEAVSHSPGHPRLLS